MKAFNCPSLHHLITHRLSRIETCDYQDKEGCSLNGSNEFLKETGILRYYSIHSIIFDSRGVIVNFEDGETFRHSQEFDETILNFKQFVGIVRSTIPIVEEERRPLRHIFKIYHPYIHQNLQEFLDDPIKFFTDNLPTVSTCFGHVISLPGCHGFNPTIDYEKVFSSYEQLPHFRSLNCSFHDFKDDNSHILEEFGNVFATKLVHLVISIRDCEFSSNQIEDCFSQFTKLKSLTLRDTPNLNPSLTFPLFILFLSL